MNEPSELTTTISRPLCIEGWAIVIAGGYNKIPQETSAVTSDYTQQRSQRSNLTYSMYTTYNCPFNILQFPNSCSSPKWGFPPSKFLINLSVISVSLVASRCNRECVVCRDDNFFGGADWMLIRMIGRLAIVAGDFVELLKIARGSSRTLQRGGITNRATPTKRGK